MVALYSVVVVAREDNHEGQNTDKYPVRKLCKRNRYVQIRTAASACLGSPEKGNDRDSASGVR